MQLRVNKEYIDSYICEIEENSGILKWQYTKDTKVDCVLIVRTPFDSQIDISNIVEDINQNGIELEEDQIVNVNSEISCKLAGKIQGKVGIYNAKDTPALYSVYGCKKENDYLTVYDEQESKYNQCNVRSVIEYSVEQMPILKKEGGFFRKIEKQYNFSKIVINPNKDYVDGALSYTFENYDISYPISKKMIGKPFFVRWLNDTNIPLIKANIEGFKAHKI